MITGMEQNKKWVCSICTTQLSSHFDVCWNCGCDRTGKRPSKNELPNEDTVLPSDIPFDDSAPSPQANKNMLIRYQDGYRVAKVIQGFGEACKVLGIVIGVLVTIVGLIASSISGFVLVIGLVLGAIVGFVGWAIGVLISAQGQLLQATLDTAVNSSPFLSNNQRAKIMSLP